MRSPSRAALVIVALALFAPRAGAQEPSGPAASDNLEAQRERFRAGLEKYRAGAFAEAILIWENIYDELGPEKGYRLAFNLARAYEQFGNGTRAAESYEAYVKEAARRREAGETLEPVVEKQEAEAKDRLTDLAATQARIRIAGDRGVVVKIDGGADRFAPRTGLVAYVTPDRDHTVTFDPGTKGEQRVTVRVDRGSLVELAPPAPKVEPPRPVEPPPPPSRLEIPEERPFSKTVLYVAAGVTAVSTIVPLIFYVNASSTKAQYDETSLPAMRASSASGDVAAYNEAYANGERQKDDYESRRRTAYASLAIPAVLGAATIGLAAYWLFYTKEQRVPVTVTGGLVRGGAALGAAARF